MTARRRSFRLSRARLGLALVGVAVVGVTTVLAVAGGRGGEAPPPRAATAGAHLLDIELSTFDGAPVRLDTFAGGQPLVVNFFASWCAPCVREMPDFEAVHRRRDDVRFLGVSLQDTAAAASQLATQTGVTYDLAQDGAGELFRAVDGFSMPTTVFIDVDGTIVDVHGGELSQRDLESRIDRLVQR